MKNLLNTQQKLLKQQQQSSALIGVHPNCFAHLARISKRNFFFGLVMKLILLLINFYTMTKLLFLSIWLKTYLVTTT